MHRDIWPEVTFTHDVELVSSTLDEIVDQAGMDFAGPGALVMDTQGSELLVLQGASKLLREVLFLKVEAADFESYLGCATEADLTSYLGDRDFRLLLKTPFAQHPAGGHYYELFFRRD